MINPSFESFNFLPWYKKILNQTTEEINKKVLKSKEKEKSKITLRFNTLTIEELLLTGLVLSMLMDYNHRHLETSHC